MYECKYIKSRGILIFTISSCMLIPIGSRLLKVMLLNCVNVSPKTQASLFLDDFAVATVGHTYIDRNDDG